MKAARLGGSPSSPFGWIACELAESGQRRLAAGVIEMMKDRAFLQDELAAQKALRHVPPVGPQGHPEPVGWVSRTGLTALKLGTDWDIYPKCPDGADFVPLYASSPVPGASTETTEGLKP